MRLRSRLVDEICCFNCSLKAAVLRKYRSWATRRHGGSEKNMCGDRDGSHGDDKPLSKTPLPTSPGFSASSFNSAFMLLHPCVCREIRKEGGGAAGFLTGDDACSECIYCSGRVVEEEEEERSEVVVPSAAWRSRAAGVVKFTSVAAALPAAPMEQLRGEPINDALLVSPSTIPNPLPSFIVFLVTFAPGHICMKKTYLRIEEHRCVMRSHFWTFHSMRCK
ncbi:hypothetical protein GW17_00022694 [Ensete ventricosum]|nr:hypothetical protein GW17_00022694 [Ensete ventricosum]